MRIFLLNALVGLTKENTCLRNNIVKLHRNLRLIQGIIFPLVVSLPLFCGNGCSSIAPTSTPSVRISSKTKFRLCRPEQIGKSYTALYEITLLRKSTSHQFPIVAEVERDHITLVALTSFGTRAFSVSFKEGQVDYRPATFFKTRIDPKYLICLFQLIFWPRESIEENFKGDTILVEDRTSSENRRSIYKRSEEIIRISYSMSNRLEGEIQFEHFDWSYKMELKTLQFEPLFPVKSFEGKGKT